MDKTENSDLLDNDENAVFCPACGSNEVEQIPDEDKVISYGAFALMDVPMLLNRVSSTYQCQQCYYEW